MKPQKQIYRHDPAVGVFGDWRLGRRSPHAAPRLRRDQSRFREMDGAGAALGAVSATDRPRSQPAEDFVMLFDLDASESIMAQHRCCDPFACEFGRPAMRGRCVPTRKVFIDALTAPGAYPVQIGAIRTGIRARRDVRPATEIPAVR